MLSIIQNSYVHVRPLQALEEQFPKENYRICCYDAFKFNAEELHIIVGSCDTDQCVIALKPPTAKVNQVQEVHAILIPLLL